ncbi:response regulator, partial [Anaerosolibacter sp.]|uniref:response regulator n=1 Tax=Anaerosolibacter sp. TaxID=1872527 RepID=UPI0039EFF6E0
YQYRPDPIDVIGDPSRFSQILNNLISNAINTKKIGAEKEKIWIEISIMDTGIGIPEDKINSIFDNFTQVRNQSIQNPGGTGRGLAITKRLIEMMEGTISVKSQVGKGSIFSIILPFKMPNREFKILVAEDNEINQLVIKKMLEWKGYNAVVVENGKAVLSLLEDKRFDLIIMDILMHEMDEYETTRQIREKEKKTGMHIPIVAVTAYAFDEDRKKCLEAGMDDYISKPINTDELYNTIERLIVEK